MKSLKVLLALLLLPTAAFAGMNINGVSGLSEWYFHANFVEMRNSESGKLLYDWLDGEVFDEIREETGMNLGDDLNSLIAESDGNDNVVVVFSGNIRQEYQDQMMALMATQNLDLAPRKSGGKTYYFTEGNGDTTQFNDGVFFSFDLKDKIVITSKEDKMQEILANGANVVVRRANTLIMFSAKNDATGDGEMNGDWDSNIIQNTEEALVTISDDAGKFRVQAELAMTTEEIADSMASVVRGLISLQAFNDDIEPEISEVLSSTDVAVNGSTLSISLSVDAQTVVNEL